MIKVSLFPLMLNHCIQTFQIPKALPLLKEHLTTIQTN